MQLALPASRCQTIVEIQGLAIEHRPGGSLGRSRKTCGGNRLQTWALFKQTQRLGLAENLICKVVPSTGGFAAVVIQAPLERTITLKNRRQRPQGIGNTASGSRTATLIRYHGEFIAVATKAKHGFDEVVALDAEHPTGSQNQMA